jgi:formamidopyrimidine-DNA glycosylase
MAEVPEIEILVRDLATLAGRVIVFATVQRAEIVRYPTPEMFPAILTQRTIKYTRRRAKYILIELSNDGLLAMHCALYGTLQLIASDTSLSADTLVEYHLDDGQKLILRDELGYARAAAGPTQAVIAHLRLNELGPELLDECFDTNALLTVLERRRGVLKNVVINQRIIAGLGNRDADESLWLAQIAPQRDPRSLTEAEARRLLNAARRVLAEGLDARGTMTDLWGVRGTARHRRNVYGQYGTPCPRCGTRIARIKLGTQMTYYCPLCQQLSADEN